MLKQKGTALEKAHFFKPKMFVFLLFLKEPYVVGTH